MGVRVESLKQSRLNHSTEPSVVKVNPTTWMSEEFHFIWNFSFHYRRSTFNLGADFERSDSSKCQIAFLFLFACHLLACWLIDFFESFSPHPTYFLPSCQSVQLIRPQNKNLLMKKGGGKKNLSFEVSFLCCPFFLENFPINKFSCCEKNLLCGRNSQEKQSSVSSLKTIRFPSTWFLYGERTFSKSFTLNVASMQKRKNSSCTIRIFRLSHFTT